jgi:hypothetical protein
MLVVGEPIVISIAESVVNGMLVQNSSMAACKSWSQSERKSEFDDRGMFLFPSQVDVVKLLG